MIEYKIYQNKILGAHVIWEFAKSFTERSVNHKYPSIYHMLPVLPLCLNKRVNDGIKDRFFKEGSLIRAINENKDVFSGLQERMEGMANLTFESIFLAAQARLVIFDREKMEIIPNNISYPSKLSDKLFLDYKDVLKSSRRIGSWFSNLSIEELLMYFNIVF